MLTNPTHSGLNAGHGRRRGQKGVSVLEMFKQCSFLELGVFLFFVNLQCTTHIMVIKTKTEDGKVAEKVDFREISRSLSRMDLSVPALGCYSRWLRW